MMLIQRLPSVAATVLQGWRRGQAALDVYGGDPVPAAMLAATTNGLSRYEQAQLATVLLSIDGQQTNVRKVAHLVDEFWRGEAQRRGGLI